MTKDHVIERLNELALEHDLIFKWAYSEDLADYILVFHDKKQNWFYRKELSRKEIDSFAGSSSDFAQAIFDVMQIKVKELKNENSSN